jgi:Protein kinase domain
VEEIMESFMNKLFSSPLLLEDEKLNSKIERIFENKLFQKMVENTNVLEEAGLGNSEDRDGDSNGTMLFEGKMILDYKAMEKCDLIAPYVPDEPAVQEPKPDLKFEKLKLSNKKNFTKPKTKEDGEQSAELSQISRASDFERQKKDIESLGQQLDEQPGGAVSEIASEEQALQDESELIESQSMKDMIDTKEEIDQFDNDDDVGFECYEVVEREFANVSNQLAAEFNFPARAVRQGTRHKKKRVNPYKLSEAEIMMRAEKKTGYIYLDPKVKHPASEEAGYPLTYNQVVYDCFHLKVIYNRERTGFEEVKEFQIVIGSVVAGRYKVAEFLGEAAFSKAIQCVDLKNGMNYCLKVIENNKDYFDQSIDEIKLLRYINVNGDVDQNHVLRLHDFFYHKEHLFIVTELLKDNLYDYYKFNREKEAEEYFTVGRLQTITFQLLKGLSYIHSLKLVHCDLKPENIMMKSYSRAEVKIIDFGSSCFVHDNLGNYVQSRAYRAPEVILGCKYDYKIDIWSLGCILSELYTGSVLFQSDSLQGLLARIIAILGPFPEWMLDEGKLTHKYFTKEKLLYQDVSSVPNLGIC